MASSSCTLWDLDIADEYHMLRGGMRAAYEWLDRCLTPPVPDDAVQMLRVQLQADARSDRATGLHNAATLRKTDTVSASQRRPSASQRELALLNLSQ
jgi:hypothetical protein